MKTERQSLEARLERHANAQYRARRRELDDIQSIEEEVEEEYLQNQAILNAVWLANHRFYK